jgi:hypothetical protein
MEKDTPHPDIHCCYNCHFITTHPLGISGEFGTSLNDKGRKKLLNANNKQEIHKLTGPEHRLCCQKEMWQHKRHEEYADDKPLLRLLTRDRRDACFFYPYEAGIAFDAATELQERDATKQDKEADRTLARQANSLSRRSLVIAALALLATIALGIWAIWAHLHPATPPK